MAYIVVTLFILSIFYLGGKEGKELEEELDRENRLSNYNFKK